MTVIEDYARSLFLAALERAPDQWSTFLDKSCGGNTELRARVDQLLQAHQAMGSIHAGAADAPAGSSDDPITERPGSVIGPYKLLQQIGEGGMGIVFMAEQEHPVRRRVALKIIKPGMDSKQVIARFEAERQALAMMDHQNIAKVFDAGRTAEEPGCVGEPGCVSAGRPYFVMELVHGVPITQFCDENQLTPRERLALFVPVCQAIQHAHQKGIIHRDIKPSNVLVTLCDEKPVPKVIDFGVAKAIEQRLTEKTLFTQFGVLVGTFEYMSPEQADMNALGVDTRSDIYSLGVLLYELLTGTTPLERERLREAALSELVRLIKEEEPPRPSARLSSSDRLPTIAAARKTEPAKLPKLLRGEIDWMVMKCLDKDPSRRYETANGLARDVERYLHDEAVEACPPSAVYRLRKFARKHRKILAGVGMCVLAALFAAGLWLWLAQKRAETAGAVQEALQRAVDLQGQNRWPEALEAAQRADKLLQVGGGSADLGRRVQEALADLKMVLRLEEIRLEKASVRDVRDAGLGDLQDVCFLYAEAFRNYGIDVETLETAEAAKQIRARPIHVQLELVIALDHWAYLYRHSMPRTGDETPWQHLVSVARGADPDRWRNQLRAALGRSTMDKKLLQDLAGSAELAMQSAPTLLLLGNYLADAGAVESAVTVLLQGQQWHPDNFWITSDLAYYLEKLSPPQTNEAVVCYRAAVALRPHSARTHYYLGQALLKQGAMKPAIGQFNEAMRFMPEPLTISIGWGDALNKKNALDEAVAAFKEASRLKPEEAGIYINWARALMNQGALDEAIAAFDRAIATLKARPVPSRSLSWCAYSERAEALIALGRFEEAEQSLRQGIELDPSNYWHWYLDTLLRLYLGDVAGYRSNCQEMLARFSDTGDFLITNRVAAMCMLAPNAVPDLRPVLQLANRAVTSNEQRYGYLGFLLGKGMADYRAGQYATAIGRLNETLSLERELRYFRSPCLNAMANLILAMAHQRLGHADQARQALEQAKRMWPKYTKTSAYKTLGELWHQWLGVDIIRQETERLLKGQAIAAGEALRPSNGVTGPATSGRLFCAPGPMGVYFYHRPSPRHKTPRAILMYTASQTGGNAVGMVLAALAMSIADGPRGRPGFQAPLAFDAGSNPVAVAMGDFNRDGIVDMAVANNDSNNVSVLLGKGDGTFGTAVNYGAGAGPSAVAVADLNGDGILDLAVANIHSRNVSVLLGKGDGTFQAAVNYAAGGALYGVAVGDFNGDGIPDLALANVSKAGVSVLLGNGDGTFQAAVNYPAGAAPTSVAVGDFNDDGIPDLVVINNLPRGSISLLLGNGDGTFRAAVKYAAGRGAIEVAAADFNGDGILDIAVANGKSNTVSVLLGKGDGTFQAAVSYAAGGGSGSPPRSVAVGDFNGDGIPDLAVVTDRVGVLLGKGDGTFQAPVSYAGGYYPSALASGDFNGDGKLDLAVTNSAGNNVGVVLGKGDGTFQAAPSYRTGVRPMSIAAGDFNGDGISDLAVANLGGLAYGPHQGTVSILLGKDGGNFQAAVDSKMDLMSAEVVVGDFNGDGIPDLVVSNVFSNTLRVLLGSGDGTFKPAASYPAGDIPATVAVGDFNGDGILDLAVANSGLNTGFQGTVSVLLGKGDGTFQAPQNYAAGVYSFSVAVADFNGDGIPDLVVANTGGIDDNYHGGSVGVLLGNGDGTFQPAVHSSVGISAFAMAVGDFNGDGFLDLAVADLVTDGAKVLMGKGDGTFQTGPDYAIGPLTWYGAGGAHRCVAVSDFNGDGIPDLAVSYFGGVRLLLGNGDGTFQTTPISYLAGPDSLAVGDFNGDGLPDLAGCFGGLNQVSVLLNDGKWAP